VPQAGNAALGKRRALPRRLAAIIKPLFAMGRRQVVRHGFGTAIPSSNPGPTKLFTLAEHDLMRRHHAGEDHPRIDALLDGSGLSTA
jgi:hypothetical protein